MFFAGFVVGGIVGVFIMSLYSDFKEKRTLCQDCEYEVVPKDFKKPALLERVEKQYDDS